MVVVGSKQSWSGMVTRTLFKCYKGESGAANPVRGENMGQTGVGWTKLPQHLRCLPTGS